MTTLTETTVRVFRVYIKASVEAVWEAITSPEWTKKYGYRGSAEYDLRPGGVYRGHASAEMLAMGTPEVLVDGEVIEVDPPRRLVQTHRFLWDPAMVAEGFTRLTWEVEEAAAGLTRLTVTHDLTNAPKTAEQIVGDMPFESGGGGWSWVLSDLKTLLETGKAIDG